MRLVLALILALFLALPAKALTISTPDPGGNIMTYLQMWERVKNSGEKVVIDAPCISACTFFLGFIDPSKVCVTPRASLGFHQVSDPSGPDAVFSTAFYRWLYPQWVQQWLKDEGGVREDLIFMYPEDMKGHINLCPGYTYSQVKPHELIHHPRPEEQGNIIRLPAPK